MPGSTSRRAGNASVGLTPITADPGRAPEDSYNNRHLMINAIGRFDEAEAELLTEGNDYDLLKSG